MEPAILGVLHQAMNLERHSAESEVPLAVDVNGGFTIVL